MINLEGLTDAQIDRLRNIAESMRQKVVVGNVKCIVTSNNTYHFEAKDLLDVRKVIGVYPVNLENCKLQIDNPPVINSAINYQLRIMYHVGDGDDKKLIWLAIPLKEVIGTLVDNSIIEKAIRSPYDCEYHYFIGTPMAKIKKMQIPYYRFCHDNTTYYGGVCETSETSFIEEILIKLGVI